MALRALLALSFLALAACTPSANDTSQAIGAACQAASFEGTGFTHCLATPSRDDIRLYVNGANDKPLRSFDKLAAMLGNDGGHVRFAMNAGMFDANGNPIGLYVEDSNSLHEINRKSGGGNFHMLPNGVFSVEGDGWHIRTSDAFVAATRAYPVFATQSGPMLVIDGELHPQITPNGTSLNIRNAVGIDDKGNAHFVISEEPVSFGRLARYLRDGLGCKNALYFDGAVSSLWDPSEDRMDDVVPIGPMVVVMKRTDTAK